MELAARQQNGERATTGTLLITQHSSFICMDSTNANSSSVTAPFTTSCRDRRNGMTLKVVGAGVGRTGTHSLKIALEQLLGGPCHHMIEVLGDPTQAPGWISAIEGRPVDWATMPAGYVSLVDWPGCSFWPELSAANPDALVLLSVRDPESWYRSASNTIFQSFDKVPPELAPWMAAVVQLLRDRFSDSFDNPIAMMDAYERHNEAVRQSVPGDRLLEWTATDGWDPICDRLGLEVPSEPFPVTNTTEEFRAMVGMPAIS